MRYYFTERDTKSNYYELHFFNSLKDAENERKRALQVATFWNDTRIFSEISKTR